MKKPYFFTLAIILQVILLTVTVSAPAAARPLQKGQQNTCTTHKQINNFNNVSQLEAHGFFLDLFGSAEISFNREGHDKYTSLYLGTDYSGDYMASRITEVDDSFPVGERIKCWQPTADHDVVVDFTVRFEQPVTPPGLTENILLWNAPFGEEGTLPVTAIGITRNQVFPGYVATVSQNLSYSTFAGFLTIAPLPEWLDPTDWHEVRLTIGQYDVEIEVAQGANDYITVLETTVPEPIEPLAFEFSVDNEAFPGLMVPVTVPDTLDVAFYSASLTPAQ